MKYQLVWFVKNNKKNPYQTIPYRTKVKVGILWSDIKKTHLLIFESFLKCIFLFSFM